VGAVFTSAEFSVQAKEGRRKYSLRVCCTHVVRQLLVFKITWVSVHSTALFPVELPSYLMRAFQPEVPKSFYVQS